MIVNTFHLRVPFCDQSDFVSLNLTINTFLQFENPLIPNKFPTFREFNQFLSFVFLQGIHFFFHFHLPLSIFSKINGFLITRRFSIISEQGNRRKKYLYLLSGLFSRVDRLGVDCGISSLFLNIFIIFYDFTITIKFFLLPLVMRRLGL